MSVDPVLEALVEHDRRLAQRGVTMWLGAEPTFTRAASLAPCWTWQAEDDAGDKRAAALAVVRELAARLPVTAVGPIEGRRYPEEDRPRFAFGLRFG
ncbi:MAG: transglutaminase family protein, partial [Myxococcales bacterium]|nr:transglutaminase family protein [Myxococcales bacterium]